MQFIPNCKRVPSVRWRRGPSARKWRLMMRMTVIFLLAAVFQVNAKGYAQRITLSEKHAPLGKVFKEIKRQTGYLFVYRDEWLQKAKPVDLDIADGTVEQVLDLCFRDQPLTYAIVDRTVVVRLREEKKEDVAPPPPVKVVGRVIDKTTGKPLAGASVVVKGSGLGVSSDAEGRFALEMGAPGGLLEISYTGYRTIEIAPGGRTELLIELEPSSSELDRVVMIAYGQTTKRLNTGNVSKVTAEDIGEQPVANPLQALNGRVPGMYIQSNGGMPGSNVQMQIRGVNSIAAGTNPLFIVDGVPFGNASGDLVSVATNTGITGGLSPFNSLNPSDIESIEVLKDADATAIYGSRGANGVVLITTKKGRAGKTTLSVNVSQGREEVPHFIPMLGIGQYLALRKSAFANDGITPNSVNAPDLIVWDQNKNTEWQKKLIGGKAAVTDAQLSISGGNSQTRFLFGGSYRSEGSVFPGDLSDRRGTARLNVDHNSTDKKFLLNVSVSYSSDKNDQIEDLTPYTNLPPNDPVYDSTGQVIWRPDAAAEPYALLNSPFNNSTGNLIGSASMHYSVTDHLKIKANLGYTETDVNQFRKMPLDAQNPAYATTGYSYFGDSHVNTWNAEPQVEYSNKFGFGGLDLLVGSTFQQTVSQGKLINAGNYSSDQLLDNIAAAGTLTFLSNYYTDYRYSSAFGRLGYNWQNKYLLDVCFRRDGSSRFGSDRKFGNFGSVGGAWIFSEEGFIRNSLKWLSFGKIRGSYGITGNDQITDYQYLSSYSATTYRYQIAGLRASRLANPDYSWETDRKAEAAIELGFLHDAVLVSVSYFRNESGNQLVSYPLAGQTGFSSYQANLPAKLQNTGVEFTATSVNMRTKTFSWTTNFNLTIPRNKLLAFPNIGATSYGTTNMVVGMPLDLAWGYHYLGVDPATGNPLVQDVNGDKVIEPTHDYVPIGTRLPRFYGGLGNRFQYGNFHLDLYFVFAKKIATSLRSAWVEVPGTDNNQDAGVYNAVWKAVGDKGATMPAATTSGYVNNYTLSDAGGYEDASYVKLKSCNIAYEFGRKLVSKWKMEKLTVFLQGGNLFTLTRYKGYDPEASFALSLPNLRTMAIGIHTEF